MSSHEAVWTELQNRGLTYQCTDEAGLVEHLKRPRTLYCGFDPTADSLTVGNLVPIMTLRTYQRFGHRPIVVAGGATGRIGDPSGKDAERTLMTFETIENNIEAQKGIFRAMLGDDVKIVDNNDWFQGMSAYGLLRDVGKHFSVNRMMARDSVRNRLEREGQGISYTEFSYMLLQAYDFWHLYREEGVTVQTAGADQWGNIASGVDYIRRLEGHDEAGSNLAFGTTAPLLTRADGGKFGKTEAGAIWLSHKRPSGAKGTSPYDYFQFWLNASDDDVRRYLLLFTELAVPAIEELMAAHEKAPNAREAQRTLAREATAMLHGADEMKRAESAAQALFTGDVKHLDLDTIRSVFDAVPSSQHDYAALSGDGLPLVDVLAQTSLAKSKKEARKHLSSGAIFLNGERVDGETARLTARDLLHDELVLLRRGKKTWHVTNWGKTA